MACYYNGMLHIWSQNWSQKRFEEEIKRHIETNENHNTTWVLCITHYLWSPQPLTACPIHDMADKAQWLNAKERNQMLPNLTAVKQNKLEG